MRVDPGALARLRVRIEKVVGVSDTAALLDPLASVDWAKLSTTDDLDRLRIDVGRQIAESQAGTERRIASAERQIAEAQASTERQIAESQIQIRRDLLLVTGGQFFALIAAVAAVLGLA